MARRTPAAAINEYTHEIQKSISCFSRALLQATVRDESQTGLRGTLVFGDGAPVRLKSSMRLSVKIVQSFRTIASEGNRGAFRVRTLSYFYSVDDAQGREIFAYHYHPGGPSHVRVPHMHLGPGALCGCAALHRAHLPTGRICVEDFLSVLQECFSVEPIRNDWEEILRGARERFLSSTQAE